MAQINLLRQQGSAQATVAGEIPRLATKIAGGVLLAVVAYWVFLFIRERALEASVASLTSKIAAERTALELTPRRGELITRQGQLQELERLSLAQKLWSQLLPRLGESTLKSASFTQLRALADGSMSVIVTVPTTADLDRFLQVFDDPKVAANFSDLRIGAVSTVQQGSTLVSSFEVKMKFNPAVLAPAAQ